MAITSTMVLPIGATAASANRPRAWSTAGGHRAQGVEQDLGDEEPQQEGGERELVRRDRRVVDPRR